MGIAPSDADWMQVALKLAQTAADNNEVPVGALVVINDQCISQAYNSPISLCNPTAHAEVLALEKAAMVIGNYRLTAATVYVTLEPCIMCLGAMIQARIKRLVFAAHDRRAGSIESQFQIIQSQILNHSLEFTGGVLASESIAILQTFFRARRKKRISL